MVEGSETGWRRARGREEEGVVGSGHWTVNNLK